MDARVATRLADRGGSSQSKRCSMLPLTCDDAKRHYESRRLPGE